jgi:type II secretory pathway component GspD/PulD (secretin)/tetratricopeptide (TPR) repeat protein
MRALLAFALILCLGLVLSCASGEPAPEPPQDPQPAPEAKPPEPTPAPEAKPPDPAPAPDAKTPQDPAPAPEVKPQEPQTDDEKYNKILKEFLGRSDLKGQQQMLESQKWYDIAVAHKTRGEYEKAKIAVEKALEIWPMNMEARRLKDTVDSILRHPNRSPDERVIDRQIATIKGQIIETMNHIRAGERFLAAREYEKALSEFEEAEVQILAMPEQIPEKGSFLPVVKEYKKKIKDSMDEEVKIRLDNERKKNEEIQKIYAESEKREIIKKIANLLEMAYMAFDQRRYQAVVHLCDKILWIDHTYTVAQELKEDAQKVLVKHEYRENVKRKILGWKAATASDEEARIPYQDLLVFPVRAKWQEVERRAQESVLKSIEEIEEPEVIADVKNKLNSMKIDMNYTDEPFENVLAFLREYTGLNFIVDPEAGADMSKAISFKVKGITVSTALKFMLEQMELSYTVTEDKVVMITKPENALGKPVLDLYDIRDLVVRLSNFPGPRLELLPGAGAGGGPGVTFTLEEPEAPKVSSDDIVTLITENLSPKVWEQSDKYSINMTPNQQLLVAAPSEVHKEVREFLSRLRSYSGLMVNVEVRFLAAYDDNLQEVQVDLPATTGASTAANLTDLHDITLVGGANFINPWTWVPGFFESATIQGQVFHTLLTADPVFAAAGLPIVNDPISGRIRNQGGLGLSYAWTGDQAITAFLRAVDKHQKATIVQAPRITAFNGQRAHILSVTRLAYIRDIDAGAVGFAGGLDLVIGYLNHGVVLDVRPIVSHDRRYVTMEIRADYAELVLMRFMNLANAALIQPAPVPQLPPQPGQPPPPAPTAVPPLAVQLPFLVYQRVNTTALVPDRGTLIIGGFRDLQYQDHYSGLPFYENIPVLDFFFSKKGKRHEKRRLFILVTPEIVDVAEREKNNFD